MKSRERKILVACLIAVVVLLLIWGFNQIFNKEPQSNTYIIEFDVADINSRVTQFRNQSGLFFDNRVIQEMKSDEYKNRARSLLQNITKTSGIEVKERFKYLPYAVVELSSESLLKPLAQQTGILSFSLERICYTVLSPMHSVTGQDYAVRTGNTGQGTSVAVFDTGIIWDHELVRDFADRIIVDEEIAEVYPDPSQDPTESMLHGTLMAHRIAQTAPETKIIMLDVYADEGFLSPKPGASETSLIRACDWVLEHYEEYNIVAVNISLADGEEPTGVPSVLDSVFQALRDAGIMPICASGNGGYRNGVEWPASEPLGVSVGEFDLYQGEISRATSYGSNLDFLTPNSGGTSYACAYMSGAWAILRGSNNAENLQATFDKLKETGIQIMDRDDEASFPLIQIDDALGLPPVVRDTAESADRFGWAMATGDFNNDGKDDLAIGAPKQAIEYGGDQYTSGAVNVIYGSDDGLTAENNQILYKRTGITNWDFFGGSLAAADFDGDGYCDLAVGEPDAYVYRGYYVDNAGSVHVFYGSPNGFPLQDRRVQIWNQESEGIIGSSTEGDNFGYALATGDFNHDSYADLAIGVPYERESDFVYDAVMFSGVVQILYGSSSGLSASGNQIWHQNVPGVDGMCESGDVFGISLASGDFNNDAYSDLAIGVSGEAIGDRSNAGMVQVLFGSPSGLSSQGSQSLHGDVTGILVRARAGDCFGDSLASGNFGSPFNWDPLYDYYDDLAVGVPGYDLLGENVGCVVVFYGSQSGLSGSEPYAKMISQLGYSLSYEAYNWFGRSLSSGNFDGWRYDDLAIGIPLKDSEGNADSGAVAVVFASSDHLSQAYNQYWTPDNALIGSRNSAGDLFGHTLASGDFNGDDMADLAIAVYEDLPNNQGGIAVWAGCVYVLYGTENRLGGSARRIYQGGE